MLLGDVSGKGVAAAVVTSFVRYTVRGLAVAEHGPRGAARDLLDAAMQRARRPSTTARWWSPASARRTAPGRLRSASPATRSPCWRPRTARCTSSARHGTPVGLVPIPSSTPSSIDLRRRDRSSLYTDGVTEARADGGMFGDERLVDLFADLPATPAAITDGIAEAALEFQSARAATTSPSWPCARPGTSRSPIPSSEHQADEARAREVGGRADQQGAWRPSTNAAAAGLPDRTAGVRRQHERLLGLRATSSPRDPASGRAAEAVAVDRRQDAAHDGDAQGAAELASQVVDRRADALLGCRAALR